MDVPTFLQTDSNVVVVDWPRGCQMPRYLQACGNSALVGRQISIMLQMLIDQFSVAVHPDRIHVIGFSLGAQVTGFCGRHFANSTGTRLSRITGIYVMLSILQLSARVKYNNNTVNDASEIIRNSVV